jgi:hypothetical protein
MQRLLTGLAVAAIVGIHAPVVRAGGECPPAVRSAAVKAHPDAAVTACKQEKEHGKTQYEVKLTGKAGEKLELDVSPDGTILLTEEYVDLKNVPPAVMNAFHGKYAGATPTRAEKQTAADGKVSYELAFAVSGKKKEATFTSEGGFVEEE